MHTYIVPYHKSHFGKHVIKFYEKGYHKRQGELNEPSHKNVSFEYAM